MIRALATCLAMVVVIATAQAQETTEVPAQEPPMTYERMARIITALDPEADTVPNGFFFHVENVPVLIIFDVLADRMRAMVPIREAADIQPEELMRLMQANFDSALDARYAVAQGRLWSVFIHPLSPLKRDQLISGVGQTVNIALTYGTLYSGGAMQFGGGDSGGLQRQLIDRLLDLGKDI
ncbi:MAG: hypothetical protein AAF667_00975 [Pseudomonadota bacterium]